MWVSGFQFQGYVQSNFKKMLVVTIQGGERNKELLRQKKNMILVAVLRTLVKLVLWSFGQIVQNLSKSMHMAILNSFCLDLLLESHRDLLIASQLLRPIIVHVLLQLGDVKVFMHSCDLPVQLTSVSILKSSSCGANFEVSQCFHL